MGMKCKLGDICEIVRGGSPRPIMNFVTDSSDGVNWLKIGDVNEFDKYFIKSAERITKEGALHSREVEKGDLILSNSMSFGRPFITLIDGYIHDGWLRVRNDPDLVDREYLYYFLTSVLAQNQFQAVATGSVVNNLKSETVKAVIIDLPPLPEQREIAATLSAIDARIAVNRTINHHLSGSISETDSSPDIRRGKRVSRRVTRRVDSSTFSRIPAVNVSSIV